MISESAIYWDLDDGIDRNTLRQSTLQTPESITQSVRLRLEPILLFPFSGDEIVISCRVPGTAVFFCPRGACTEWTKEKYGCPEHEIRYEGYFFYGALKRPRFSYVSQVRKAGFFATVLK